MKRLHYVGLDVHKKTIAYCVKTASGRVVEEGEIASTRAALEAWAGGRKRPWIGALEATLFTGWIYDFLLPRCAGLEVAHPAKLKALAAGKKKNDRVDAALLADLLRCDLLPTCYMSSTRTRELRRVLRYRNLLVRVATRMKNKIGGLLMEVGAEYNKTKLHYRGYFSELLDRLEVAPDSVISLLRMTRSQLETFQSAQRGLLQTLAADEALSARLARLRRIVGVGEVLALTWALEIDDPRRFPTIGQAVSYCGLCSAQRESAGKASRGPISKKRNKHLQCMLIEAAKIAPRFNPALRAVHERETARGSRNRATMAVARKLVAYLLAADKSDQPFEARPAAQKKKINCAEKKKSKPSAGRRSRKTA